MEERLALLASRGYPLEKHMTVYRMMLESCFDKWSISGLRRNRSYRQNQEKYQVLSLAPQHYNEKNDQLYLLPTILYVEQVVTTIKSILYHHRNIRFI